MVGALAGGVDVRIGKRDQERVPEQQGEEKRGERREPEGAACLRNASRAAKNDAHEIEPAQRRWEEQLAGYVSVSFKAANLGNAAKLQGFAVGGLQLPNIIKHVDRAIQLDPHHAPSLQFKGGLLAELPWYLGGNEQLAQDYLQKAISIDGNFTNARIILAKLLLKEGLTDLARTQLLRVIQTEHPHYPYTWARKFLPEAQRLLGTLQIP